MYQITLKNKKYKFNDLKDLMAKATPLRSGDILVGVAAESLTQMVAAQMILADLPLSVFTQQFVIDPEIDEISRLIIKQHDLAKFAQISSMCVGELREYLLSYECTPQVLADLRYALTPEIVAAVSKIMRNQDLIAVAAKCEVITKFRTTIGLKGRMSTRLQPNHATDDKAGIAASIIEGLLYASGDAVIGINPATDDINQLGSLVSMLDGIRQSIDAPIQNCVLTHISNSIILAKRKLPVDLFFQSIGGTEGVNSSFGVSLEVLQEAFELGKELNRGQNYMYFETGQGSALSANANHGVDQQTVESRAYAVAREFNPLLVNTVVGFIGPEYLYNGKQIIRAGLEDQFCGKLLGIPMGCDVCYTNHADADQNDMDNLLTLLGVAGCSFIMGIPGSDDIMLNYQSTSFHDAIYLRNLLGLRPAPEFENWLKQQQIWDGKLINKTQFAQLNYLLQA
ncbi:MAG TPA: ethanolamine ammonia-lyase subunit EutB [Burkholderiales bacterium]|nr:ethanolamine ammonia-lyase subunit EutB [Burkholderiales bacterium]